MSRDFYALFQIQMPARRIDLQDTQNNIVSGELTHLIKNYTENGILNAQERYMLNCWTNFTKPPVKAVTKNIGF